MTATERLFRGDQDEYVSMDDPRDYGDTIYQLSFKAAIDMKPPIISDYKIITFGIGGSGPLFYLARIREYANRLNVDEMVDLATLTGACMVALGLSLIHISEPTRLLSIS